MSIIAYISFPKELKVFHPSDIEGREKEFGINYETSNLRKDILLFPKVSPWESNIIIADKKEATFNNCLKNLFIYEFCISLPREYYRQKADVAKSNKNDDTKKQEILKIAEKWWLVRNKLLHDFINDNLIIGELVEIYTTWHDHVNFNFEPPTSEDTIDLEDVLNMPLPRTSLKIDTSHKLTICKTK
ncbi:MAG: hypothetical protein FWC91_14470 [Defluviitaleaceae bacterium]|nr:hypothetical protein [Defluviitaleaceae bacterium]